MAEDKYEAKRAELLAASLGASHEPKFGYFGYTAPLAIGENSLAPSTTRKIKTEEEAAAEPLWNIKTNPPKKGATPDVYFSFGPPLCLDDPYVDPMLRTKKPKCKPVDPEAMFKPPGKIKHSVNKLGFEYIPHQNNIRDPQAMHDKYKDYTAPRNFFTSPAKKGGGGIYTLGVLFGNDETRKFYDYHSDDFDSARKLRVKELEEHRAKLPEQQFRSMHYGNRAFQKDDETYHNNGVPCGVPREVKPLDLKPYPHENPFRPSNPPLKGHKATFTPFPEHMVDPVPAPPQRKPPPAEDAPPAFRMGHPPALHNPMPSVSTHLRNLRSENPRSFVRPCV